MALILTDGGMQRMTARVLAAFLFTEQPTLTQGEVAEELGVSAGSVSGAIKMLTTVGLLERVPVANSRRDHHRLRKDAWATLFTKQNHIVGAMQEAARAGLEATGEDSIAGQRLKRMHDFYAFLFDQLPELLDRWYREADREKER
ncbi:MarR family transcriptional regulator [Nocardiopsis gilva YIM 90087]|uniref:MarR family transcriptional regulator n=1 Tax=Nocardiopsis gilva YIM 90087 TaxID=1235441 RepID=A0A223S7C5_9ACTN|nr:MarR family transcriptional regulator [Nocardiopsis gilva YIM 90087]